MIIIFFLHFHLRVKINVVSISRGGAIKIKHKKRKPGATDTAKQGQNSNDVVNAKQTNSASYCSWVSRKQAKTTTYS
jgi:hypothetical protein